MLNAEVVMEMLDVLGYHAVHIDNAKEGIEYAQKQKVSLIMMDIQMPDMDGFTATQKLKKDPCTTHIPIFAITAFAMKEAQKKAFAAGCEKYLTKPIDFDILNELLNEYLPKK